MEEELGEPLPYWDWTEDDEVPDLWEGINSPLKEGVPSQCDGNKCKCEGKQFVSRSPNITIDKEVQKKNTKAAFEKRNFKEFHNRITQPHNWIHIDVGCDMSISSNAAYDPIFFLHHTYVDLQFAYWQAGLHKSFQPTNRVGST